MTMFESIENYKTTLGSRAVCIAFRTAHRGIWQCWYDDDGITEVASEPSFYTLKKSEQEEIEEIAPFIYYTVFGEMPKQLNSQRT